MTLFILPRSFAAICLIISCVSVLRTERVAADNQPSGHVVISLETDDETVEAKQLRLAKLYPVQMQQCLEAGGENAFPVFQEGYDPKDPPIVCRCGLTPFNPLTHSCNEEEVLVARPVFPPPIVIQVPPVIPPPPDNDISVSPNIPNESGCDASVPAVSCTMKPTITSSDVSFQVSAAVLNGDFCEYTLKFTITAGCGVDVVGWQDECPFGCQHKEAPEPYCVHDIENFANTFWADLFFATNQFGTGKSVAFPETPIFRTFGPCGAVTKEKLEDFGGKFLKVRVARFRKLILEEICQPALDELVKHEGTNVSWTAELAPSCEDRGPTTDTNELSDDDIHDIEETLSPKEALVESSADTSTEVHVEMLTIHIEGHKDVVVPCKKGDWSCQAHFVCNSVTGMECVHQDYDCATGTSGSWYPPDGASGGSSFNFAYAYDLNVGSYGNICACDPSQMLRYGLSSDRTYCGLGVWYRDGALPESGVVELPPNPTEYQSVTPTETPAELPIESPTAFDILRASDIA